MFDLLEAVRPLNITILSMAIYGYLWLSIGYLLVIFSVFRFVGVGYLRLSMVIFGYLWLSL